MDITWYGHSCFRIVERGRISVVTDPFNESIGLSAPRLKGDVVTISHDEPGHNHDEAVKGQRYVLRTPGEYEIGGVFITGIAMHTGDSYNVAYKIEYDALAVLHLGDLASVPEQSVFEELGTIHALLVPVGGGRALKASQAAEVVGMVEPHFVVPMHYGLPGLAFELEPADRFLKAMGISKVHEAETLKISVTDLPEQPQVVMLSLQG